MEGTLVLSIRMLHLEILVWDPGLLGDIWLARNSKTFELCLSVRPSRLRPNAYSYRLDILHISWYYPYAGWYWKWVHMIWYLPYKSNPHTGVLGTWNFRFIPNLIFACILTCNMITKSYLDRFTGFGTSHINQISILGTWAHVTSNSNQIWYLDMYTKQTLYEITKSYLDWFAGSGTSGK